MAAGIWVLSFFATLWAAIGVATAGFPQWSYIVPLAISAVIATICLRLVAGADMRSVQEGRRIGRLVVIWSAVEGIAIFVAVNVLDNLGLARFDLPAIAVIVGLHFIPLARGLPARLYYGTGAALVVLGLAATLLPIPDIAPTAGFGAAIILWASCMLIAAGRATGRASGRAAALGQQLQ